MLLRVRNGRRENPRTSMARVVMAANGMFYNDWCNGNERVKAMIHEDKVAWKKAKKDHIEQERRRYNRTEMIIIDEYGSYPVREDFIPYANGTLKWTDALAAEYDEWIAENTIRRRDAYLSKMLSEMVDTEVLS